ncbi:class I SAM-dependent methyltransferase, partial [Azospirillum sp. A39]
GFASSLQRQKKYAAAKDAFRRHLRNNPDDVRAMNDLATTEVDDDNVDEGARLYRHALSRKPSLAGCRANLAALTFSRDRVAATIEELERALKDAESNFNTTKILLDLAFLYRLSGCFEHAERLYARTMKVDGDFVYEALAIRDSHDYIINNIIAGHAPDVEIFGERWKVFDSALNAARCSGLQDGVWCEFGVYRGVSLRYLARRCADAKIHGFDSFEGLPENWTIHDSREKYTTHGQVPDAVGENVALHVGLFEDTVPKFLRGMESVVRFLHIDCDLYSSTHYVLTALSDRIARGTVIVFDEYFGYHGWRDHEMRAFQQFSENKNLTYRYIAVNAFGKQAAIVIV